MTEQQLRELLASDIVLVAVPGHIHSLTLHPRLCSLERAPQAFIGWVAAWSTNSGQWISVDPHAVVAVVPQKITVPEPLDSPSSEPDLPSA